MIILDTNLVSELIKPAPATVVASWFMSLDRTDVALSSVTLFEIRFGLKLLPPSARRQRLELAYREIKDAGLFGPLLPFGPATAEHAADIFVRRRQMGRPVEIPDCLIAGTVLEHGATLATRNVRDFEGVGLSLINPWDTAS
ncbi:type II toxin-antitoxin system VapC family toxin [Aureimonas glaciei]|uniref:Ribonuclease VapC n=1 Tax=Aureimonas glaciei TaxID=1776957 RepID=A0A916XSH6_9HYPH|nr:type II toxin-antitoxin system VapC family toxin [Aureimonas glaciei]GGD03807.1 ribonuclease VapC [Aureimonas glaciei]